MKLPIQYALFYPDRRTLNGKRVNFFDIANITFFKPDRDKFKGFDLAFKAGKTGGSLPTIYNAANELAVSKFLNEEIRFLDIPELIETAMNNHKVIDNPSLEQILESEKEAYESVNIALSKR